MGWNIFEAATDVVVDTAKDLGKGAEDAGDVIVNGVKTAGDAVKDTAEDTAIAVGNAMTDVTEQVSPNKELIEEFKRKQQELTDAKTQLSIDHDSFISTLMIYREYLSYNFVLMFSGTVLKMTDNQFDAYLKLIDNPGPSINTNTVLPKNIHLEIERETGGLYPLKAMNLNIQMMDHDYSSYPGYPPLWVDGVASSEDLFKKIAVGGLSSMGIKVDEPLNTIINIPLQIAAFFASMGLMLIVDPFLTNYKQAEEQKIYTEANAQVERSLFIVKDYSSKVKGATIQLLNAIQEERKNFNDIMIKLDAIQPANFKWTLNPATSDDDYIKAIRAGVEQYGIICEIRKDWRNTQNNRPNMSWDLFVEWEVIKSKGFDSNQIKKLALLVKNKGQKQAAEA